MNLSHHPARRGVDRGRAADARGPVDLDELDKWLRVGWERRRGATSEFGFEEEVE
jgi:hypothetical protein